MKPKETNWRNEMEKKWQTENSLKKHLGSKWVGSRLSVWPHVKFKRILRNRGQPFSMLNGRTDCLDLGQSFPNSIFRLNSFDLSRIHKDFHRFQFIRNEGLPFRLSGRSSTYRILLFAVRSNVLRKVVASHEFLVAFRTLKPFLAGMCASVSL